MIAPYELSKWLATHLKGRGFQFEVQYEPRFAGMPTKNLVALRRDRTVLEPLEVVSGARGERFAKRFLPCLALVYASASVPGAHHGTHETLAYQVADALYVGLVQWVAESKVDVRFTGSRLLSADELGEQAATKTGNVWPGVVHQTQFAVGHGVFDRNADGSSATRRATIASTRTTTTIESPQREDAEQGPAPQSGQEQP
jgi:hypothetical protein